ncbi:hypothetical protein K151_1009 [Proteus hauseri ZMd44]|nr:hypothetical protein K151_1009 [Proteus hauseri ZMd44]
MSITKEEKPPQAGAFYRQKLLI